MREIQLYLHIPFCIRKCGYCDFLSGPADERAQRAYTEALLREIRVLGQRTEAAVSTIFIGGGTPSVLRADWMEEILDQLPLLARGRPGSGAAAGGGDLHGGQSRHGDA